MEELERSGVKVHFVTEPIDNDSPDGQLVRFVRAYAGKIENERKKERVMRAVRERARLGKVIPGARAPYGYQWGPEHNADGRPAKVRLLPDPITAPVVVRIYDESARGYPLRHIAVGLTQDGIFTPTGKRKWDPTTVRYLLTDPKYWGRAEALRSKEVPVEKHLRAQYASKMRTTLRAAEERVPLPASAVPALVSPEVAAEVQQRLRLNQQQATRNNKHPEASLLRGGIARCGHCGYSLAPNNHYSAYGVLRTTYQCTHRHRTSADCSAHTIEAHLLDDAVWAKVRAVMQDRTIIEHEVAQMRETEAPGTDVLAAIDTRIADIEAQIRRKRRLFELTDDERTQTELANEINALAVLRRQHEAERANAVTHFADWQQQRDGLEQMLSACERVGQNLDTFTYEERRAMLRTLKAEVRLYRATHMPRAELFIRLPLSGLIALDLSHLTDCVEDRSSSSYQASIMLQ
jgi:DNA invertase Pin-like site-specific DNA recombinase